MLLANKRIEIDARATDGRFEFDTLPEDWDHFMPILEMATNRMPLFESAGIHTFFGRLK